MKTSLLQIALSESQRALVTAAIRAGVPVIIDGDRTKPTGKSTLCDELRALGAEVYERWELEEGAVKPDNDKDCNSVNVVIRLTEGLFT